MMKYIMILLCLFQPLYSLNECALYIIVLIQPFKIMNTLYVYLLNICFFQPITVFGSKIYYIN